MAYTEYNVWFEIDSGSWTDVSSDVLRMTFSQNVAGIFWPFREGRAMIELDNSDGEWSPDYPGSPHAGKLRPTMGVKAEMRREYVANKDGRLGDTTNWTGAPGITWVGSDGYGGGPHFAVTGYGLTVTSSEFIYVDDVTDIWTVSGVFRTDQASTTLYAGLVPYDSQKIRIRFKACWRGAGRDTTIVGSVVAGGTTVDIAPSSNAWYAPSNSYIQWNIQSGGADLPQHSATQIASIDTSPGTYWRITLAQGAPATFSSGTPVGNSYDSSAYIYALIQGTAVGTAWTPTSAQITGVNDVNSPPTISQLWRGTEYVRALLLPSYSNSDTTRWDNFSIAKAKPLFYGRVIDIECNPRLDRATTIFEAADEINRLRTVSVTTSLYSNADPADVLTEIFSQSNVRSFSMDSFAGDTIAFAWFKEAKATDAIRKVIEFGKYAVYADGAGTIHVRNRLWLDNASDEGGIGEMLDFRYRLNSKRIINEARIESEPRRLSTSVRTIAWIPEPIQVTSGNSINFALEYMDPDTREYGVPATGFASLVASQDYYLATNSDGTGSNITAQASVYVQFFGSTAVCSIYVGADGYLTRFQIRGKPAQRQPRLIEVGEVSSSQQRYGKTSFTISNDLINSSLYAKSYKEDLLLNYHDPVREVRVTIRNEHELIPVLDLGDVVTVSNSITGVASQFAVIGEDHDVAFERGLMHTVTLQLEPWKASTYLILDDPVRGKLDSGNTLAF